MDPWWFYRDKWNRVGGELDWKSPQEVQAMTLSNNVWKTHSLRLVAVTDTHVYVKHLFGSHTYAGTYVRNPQTWLTTFPRGLALEVDGTIVIVKNPPVSATTDVVRALVLEGLERNLPSDLKNIVLTYAFRST